MCCFFWYSLSRLSSVSVVFDFNTSISDVAPVSPMLFSVDLMRMEKSVCCVMIVFTIQVEFCECCV